MRHISGRVAVVTGAASGIGRATSTALARRGARLALADLSADRLTETAAELSALGGEVSTHAVDVADRDAVDALARDVVAVHGACHIVVNNAGVTTAGRFEAESAEDLDWIVGVNLWGVVHGCRSFLPALRRAGEGHIVNLSSMVGLLGLPRNAAYALTKGAVRSFSEALRAELVTSGIGVTAVFPGAIRTAITDGARGEERERLARMGSSRLVPVVMRSPDLVARRIVGAIEKNRARVVVGPDARLLDAAARVLPGRSGAVGRALDRFA